MTAGIAPPSPKDLANALQETLVKRNLLHPRCPIIVNKIYAAAKRIMHKEQFIFTGKEYDEYMHEADFAVKELRQFVERYAQPRA
jgi:hypothetical protein